MCDRGLSFSWLLNWNVIKTIISCCAVWQAISIKFLAGLSQQIPPGLCILSSAYRAASTINPVSPSLLKYQIKTLRGKADRMNTSWIQSRHKHRRRSHPHSIHPSRLSNPLLSATFFSNKPQHTGSACVCEGGEKRRKKIKEGDVDLSSQVNSSLHLLTSICCIQIAWSLLEHSRDFFFFLFTIILIST